MISSRIFYSALLWSSLALGVVTAIPVVIPAANAEESIRSEVGKPLQQAQEYIKQKNYKEALSKIHDADNISNKTEYESSLIDQLRGIAASGAGDQATAIKSFESLISRGRLAPTEELRFVQVVAELAYQAKDYAKTVTWANRYYKDGGTDGQLRKLIGQAYYLQGDYANAVKELQEQIHTEEHSGQAVSEEQLQLLANAYLKQNNTAGYTSTLEKLVTVHPTPEYWADLIRHVTTKSGFADRLQLDAGRLALTAGAVKTPDYYVELIQLALQAGLPGEATTFIQRGTSAGILGTETSADADRQKRLRNLATKSADDDLKALPSSEKEAAAAQNGIGLVNTGLDYIGYGQVDKGIALIEQGIKKGGLAHPDDAKLHLGIAYLAAGRKDKALQAFKQVEGNDGTADLARLWVLQVGRSS
jgi:tetratricopeptide (TPR) repeat protein